MCVLGVVEFLLNCCLCLCLKGVGICARILIMGPGLGEMFIARSNRENMFRL